jgi:alpha-L-arabinofuranosidase
MESPQETNDALKINFVIGDPETTEEGALRASLGYPEPFPLEWVEIGNEVSKLFSMTGKPACNTNIVVRISSVPTPTPLIDGQCL